MNTYPGILIALDGIDGAGKTTQVRLLERAFTDIGESVIVSKEPTDGEWGQKLRDSAFAGRLPFEEELEAFILDRQDHLSKKIIPALKDGKIVILDRYFYSTIAYQGILVDDYRSIEPRIRANVLVPDAAFLLSLPADLALCRVTARDGKPNLFERQEDLEKAGRIFTSLAAADSTITSIDGTMSVPLLYSTIMQKLVDGALKSKRCGKAYGCDDPVYCMPRITDSCGWWSTKKKLAALPAEV